MEKEKKKVSLSYKAFIPFSIINYKLMNEWEKKGRGTYNLNRIVNMVINVPILFTLMMYTIFSLEHKSLNFTKWGDIKKERERKWEIGIEKAINYEFKKYDQNKDNYLSYDEFKSFGYNLAEQLRKKN